MAPPRQKRLVVSLVLVSLLLCFQHIISAPLQSADDDNQVVKLQYKTGGSYVYDFSSEVVTKLVGTSDDESRIKVKGQALLTARTPTEFILTVTKASFETPSGETLSGTNFNIEGTAIGFTNENGVLKCTVQLQNDDATWSANVKRALISLFTNYAYREGQYSAATYSELDVSGYNCQTSYTVTGNKYEKTRDLNTCAKRDGSFSTSQAVLYTVDESEAPQTDTTIKSDQVCTQEFSSGILRSTECTETHKLTLFSSGDGGAVTTVKSSLTFVEESNAILKITEFDTSREYKIFFDFANEDKASASAHSLNTITLLKDLCTEVSEVITSSEVSGKYLSLKKQVAKAPESGLREAYDGLNGGSICKDAAAKKKLTKLFLSAVASAGSSDSITFFADLYNDNSVVDDRLQRIYRLSLAFAIRPRENALAAVQKLLDAAPSNRLVVTAGGLAHQFCHANPECESNVAYRNFVGVLASYASKNCLSSDPKQVTDAIAGLQALGNLHELTPIGEKTVSECLLGISNRVRVNALQAFRNNPCAQGPLQEASNIFHDLKQPAHIRIHAYLALSKCMCNGKAGKIANTLKNPEEVDQVKNFVCTHAQNAVDTVSAGRNKPKLKEAFDKIKCTTYRSDVRRYSANLESSKYESTQNLGHSSEANIIYSPDSFIPKTLQANITVDHAGKSYNFLEVGVNSEGYEQYFESVFGPKGKRPQKLDAPANYGFVPRSKRAVSSAPTFNQGKIDALQSQLSVPTSTRDEKGVSDFYIRIWGTTIATKTLSQDELVTFYKGLHTPKSKEDSLKNLLVNHDVELTDQIPLPSDKLILPTVSGLPLKLAIGGSVILSLNLHSKFDENTLSLNGNWVASVNSVTQGKQTVGAGPISAGLQVEVTSYGKHNSGFALTVKRGEAESATIDAKVLFPEQTVRAFSITSKIYLVESKNYALPTKKELTYKTRTAEMAMNIPGRLFDVSTSVSARYPNVDRSLPDVAVPKFPLSGPVGIDGKFEVTDPAVKELTILLDYKTDAAKDDRSLKLVLDTPGSKVNRRIEANLKFKKTGPGNVNQEASYVSERVKAFLYITDKTAGTVNDKEIKVSYNGKDYGVKVHSDLVEEEEQISALVKTTKFQFDASYYTPGGSGTLLKGNALRSKKVEDDKTSVKLTLNAETSTPVQKSSASGTIEWESQNDGSGYKLVLTDVQGEHDKFGKYSINGKISQSKATNSFFSDISAKYGKGAQHDLNIVANADRSKENRELFEIKLASSRRPELNFDLKVDRDFSVEPKKMSLVFNKGERSITMSSEHSATGDDFVSNADITVKGPTTGGFSIITKVNKAGKKLDSDVTVKSSALTVVSKFNADYAAKSYNFDASGNGFGQDFSYLSSLTTSGDTRKQKVTIKVGDSFDLNIDNDLLNSESKASLVSVVSSNKFLTQPYTFRVEAYPETVFKNKDVTKVKKSVIQVLRGQDRITSLIAEKLGPANYKIEVYQQNIIEATVESAFSKGTMVFDTDVNIPSKRRVISNLELKASPAAVEITTEVKWDANKDPTKVLSFKSKSTRDGVNIVSKNSVDISGEARELNIETKLEPKFLNADHTFSVEYITARKTYSFAVDSRIDINDKVRGTKLGLKVDLPGQKPLNFKIDSQYTDVDAEKLFFDYYLDYVGDISDDDVKDQFLKLKMSQRPVNGGRSATIEASGRLISDTPKGISLQIDTEPGPVKVINVKYVRKDGDTKVTGIDVSVSHDKTQTEKVLAVKLNYDKFTGKPTLNADVTYRYIFNSFRDFQITETYNAAYLTFASSGENTIKIGSNDFLFKTISRLAKGGEAPVTIQDFEVNAGSENGKYTILADVRNLFTNPLGAADNSPSKIIPKFEIEVEPKLPNVKVKFVAERLPKVGNVQLTIAHDEAAVSGGQKRTTSINGKVGDQSAAFTSALEFSSGKAITDFSIKINNDPERKLSVIVQDSGSGPTAEASVSWGSKPNESIKTKGTVVKTANGGFDADLNFDKTPVTNQWSLKITRTVESDKKAKFVFNAESPDSNQIVKISVDRNIDLAAQSSVKANYEISLLKYVTGKHVGKLQIDLDRKAFAPAPGSQLTLDFEGSKDGQVIDKTKIVVRASDSEKRLTLSSDCAKPYCVDANFGLTTTENAGSLEFTIVRDNIKTGLIIEGSKSADYQTVKSDVQVFFARDKEQEDFGVAFYKEPGQPDDISLIKADLPSAASKLNRIGLDVKLDDRTLSLVSAHGAWEGSLTASACQLNVWLDKARKPNERFSYLLAKIQESANKRNFLLATGTPVSDKTFRVKSTRVFQTIQDFDVKLEIDMFKRREDALVLAVKRTGDASNDVWDSSLTSEGLGIAHKENCIFQTNGDSQTADCTVSLKSPGAPDASFKFTSNCSPQTKTVKFDQVTPYKKSYYINAEFNDAGCLKSLDYVLVGFTPGDARSIKIEKSEVPRGYIVKTSLKSEGDDFTELFLGQVVARGLGIKLTRTEKGAKNDLLEIRRVQNSTFLRSYEFLWNADNIKKTLSRLEAIIVQRSENVANLLRQRAEEVRKRYKGTQESIKTAAIEDEPTLAYIQSQVEQIAKELRVDPTKVVAKIETIRAYAKKQRETIRESVVAKILDKLADLVQSGKDTVPKTFTNIRSRIDELASSPDLDLDTLYLKQYSAGIRQFLAKLKAVNDLVYKKQKQNPTFDKVAKFVRGQLASILQGMIDLNREAHSKTFPYPESTAAYEPFTSYIIQRLATPEKQTLNDDFREMMLAKADAAGKAVLENSLYTRFAAGHAVLNIPILTEFPTLKQFFTVSRTKKGLSSGLMQFRGNFPAPGHATIYGTTAFRTFDGQVVPFSGANQYLLAYDGQKQFAVAVDISKNGENEEKAVYVSDGKDKAVITQDGTVLLNGKRSIRGAKAGSLEVVREGYFEGVRSNTAGVTVVCQKPGRWSNLSELPCVVRVSGYYSGKVAGALGNFNNDENDDPTLVDQYILK